MNQILNKVRDVDPNSSDSVKDAVSTFMQNLDKCSETNCIQSLKTLEDILERFPKYCMSHRNLIESHLVKYIDCKKTNIVILAAKCGHSLQQVRPSQDKAATSKSCWRDQMSLLSSSAHKLIGAIFTNAIDVYKNGGYFEKQNTETRAKSPLSSLLSQICDIEGTQNADDKHMILVNRLKNVFVFIQAMLVEVFPVAKPIRPRLILEVVIRALSLSSSKNYCHSADGIVDIKTQALRCMDALIICLGSNLIPYSPLVFRIVMQTLRWGNDNKTEQNSNVRRQAYSTLSNWLNVLHCHKPESNRRDARGKSWEEELVECILDDITPTRHVVQLTMLSNQPNKNLSKKAKRKLANTMLQESAIAIHIPGEKNKNTISENMCDDVAIAALECAEVFMNVCGIFLKPATHKVIQERLVRECYQSQKYCPLRVLHLCRTLDSCRKSLPAGLAPPTQYCYKLYSLLAHSPDYQVSRFCSSALLDIRLHLHSSPPPLNFVVEAPPDKDTTRPKKTVSEKNLLLLQSLIGSKRMPPSANEEVITIADEPSNKKRRSSLNEVNIDDDYARISVSSEDSGSEIEIVVDTEGDYMDNDTNGVSVEETVNSNNMINETNVSPMEIQENKANEKIDEVTKYSNIFEANTQLLLNTSQNDTVDGINTSQPIEVSYDFPNAGTSNVKILDNIEAENIPSSIETDDIQITCGQEVKNSQDLKELSSDGKEVSDTGGKTIEENKLIVDMKESTVDDKESSNIDKEINDKSDNGKYGDKEDDVVTGDINITSDVTLKIGANTELTVDDMLADFVDEVIQS